MIIPIYCLNNILNHIYKEWMMLLYIILFIELFFSYCWKFLESGWIKRTDVGDEIMNIIRYIYIYMYVY